MDLAGDKRVYQKVREITQIKYKILINNYLILIKKIDKFPARRTVIIAAFEL
jgi:hypothetical protein